MSESGRLRDLVAAYFKIPKATAEKYADAVLEAYPDQAKALGPYQHGTVAGDNMARRIAVSTGLSFGTVKGVLHCMATLAGRGQLSLATWNPKQFALAARVSRAVSSATGSAKAAASELVPSSVQSLATGLGEGVSGLGTLLKWLPLGAAAALGLYAWQQVNARRAGN